MRKNFQSAQVLIKTDTEIALIEKACRIVADTLTLCGKYMKPGVETIEIDRIAEDYILSKGGIPAFLETHDQLFPSSKIVTYSRTQF